MKRSDVKQIMGLAMAFAGVLGLMDAAGAAGVAWRNHAAPFTFLFGNDIDMHQQTRQNVNGELSGFLYIEFSGVMTADGFPVASHADCTQVNDCTAGWAISAKPATGTFLYHIEPDHPVWLLNRSSIPQPGAYAHFHFLNNDPLVAGASRQGFLLQLFATDTFCFLHDASNASAAKTCAGNGGVGVTPGLDIATHVNIVTSFPSPM